MIREYRVYEVDQYGNNWFIARFSEEMNANRFISELKQSNPNIEYEIQIA